MQNVRTAQRSQYLDSSKKDGAAQARNTVTKGTQGKEHSSDKDCFLFVFLLLLVLLLLFLLLLLLLIFHRLLGHTRTRRRKRRRTRRSKDNDKDKENWRSEITSFSISGSRGDTTGGSRRSRAGMCLVGRRVTEDDCITISASWRHPSCSPTLPNLLCYPRPR